METHTILKHREVFTGLVPIRTSRAKVDRFVIFAFYEKKAGLLTLLGTFLACLKGGLRGSTVS